LLNFHDQELTLDIVVVYVWKQSALEEAEETELEPGRRP
jgi:hypothetical protein